MRSAADCSIVSAMGASSRTRRTEVLLATGEPILRRGLSPLLSRDSSLHVIESSCGRDAFELATTIAIEVLAMDCDLPDVSGYQVTKALRKQADCPLILLFATRGRWHDSVQAGAHDFITKPFLEGEFLARVRQLADKAQESGSVEFEERSPIHVADLLRIEPSNSSVWIIERDGSFTQVPLTPKETAIMLRLARHVGSEVPIDHLLDKCWGDQRPVSPHAVEEMIRRIRSKLRHAREVLKTATKAYYLDPTAQLCPHTPVKKARPSRTRLRQPLLGGEVHARNRR